MFRLKLFGGVSLEGPSGPLTGRVVQQRQLAVLALLAGAGDKGLSRGKLVGYLWPESPEERARHSLNNSLHILRGALGEDSVLSSGDVLRLNSDLIWCDVVSFLEMLERGDLEDAGELYGGPFLDGFYADSAPEFDGWADSQRCDLANRFANLLEELALRAADAGDKLGAVHWWRRLCSLDPYNSRAAVGLIDALAAAGDRGNALQHAETHERFLKQELGTDPDADFYAAVERLRATSTASTGKAILSADNGVAKGRATRTRDDPSSTAAPRTVPRDARDVGHVRKRREAGRAGAAAVAIALIALVAYWGLRLAGLDPSGGPHKGTVLQERGRLVLADFLSDAKDSTLAIALTEALRIDLDQSPVLRIAESDFVVQALRRMDRPADASVGYETARELAVREGLKAVVAGELRSVADGYLMSVRLITARDGEVLVSLRETVSDSLQIVGALERLSRRLRQRAGESLESIEASQPLEQVTTSSLEALQLYSQAVRSKDDFRRMQLYEAAIAVDPAFAMAYRGFGARLRARGDVSRSRELTVRAYELRDRLSRRERYLVEAWYHLNVNGDVDKSISAFRHLLEYYPDDKMILHNLAYNYFLLRDFGQVEELERRAIDADSSYSYAWQALFTAVMNQDRLDEAETLLHRWAGHVPTSTAWYTEAASLAVNRGDFDSAEESAFRRRERAGETRAAQLEAEINSSGLLADLALVRGKLGEAEQHLRDVLAHLEELGDPARYLGTAIKIASLHAWHRADTSSAFRVLDSALERTCFDSLPVLERPYLQLVRFYALAGRPDRARMLLEEYEAAVSPPLRPGFGLTHNRLLGIVALSEGSLDQAIEQLGVRDRYLCAICALPPLGQAYELAGEFDSAIATYEHYVNTPYNWRLARSGDEEGLKDAFWLPVVYERLARLYDQRSEVERAVDYYGRLVELWKGADPELQSRVDAAQNAIERLLPDR